MSHNKTIVFQCSAIYKKLTYITSIFLHDKHGMTGRNKFLEDGREVLRHLLECQLDSFILTLVEMIDQIFDRLLSTTITFSLYPAINLLHLKQQCLNVNLIQFLHRVICDCSLE